MNRRTFDTARLFTNLKKTTDRISQDNPLRIGTVIDVEWNREFSLKKFVNTDTDEKIPVPKNSIIFRIRGLHDNVPTLSLPMAVPLLRDQGTPVPGESVFLIRFGPDWAWIGVLSDSENANMQQQANSSDYLFNIETPNNSDKVTLRDDSYSPEMVQTHIDPIFQEQASESPNPQRISGYFPKRNIEQIDRLEGESCLEGRFGNTILLSYNGKNDPVTYIINGIHDKGSSPRLRPDINTDESIILLGSNHKIDQFLNSYAKDNFQNTYPNNNSPYTTKYIVIDSNDIRIISKNKDILLSSNNEISINSKNDIYINTNSNLKIYTSKSIDIITGDDINVNVTGSANIDITNNLTLKAKNINIEATNFKVTANKIDLNSDNKTNIKTAKLKMDSIDISIGPMMKIKNENIQFGTSVNSVFVLDRFIPVFNTHVHLDPTGLSGPPINPAIKESVCTTTVKNGL